MNLNQKLEAVEILVQLAKYLEIKLLSGKNLDDYQKNLYLIERGARLLIDDYKAQLIKA